MNMKIIIGGAVLSIIIITSLFLIIYNQDVYNHQNVYLSPINNYRHLRYIVLNQGDKLGISQLYLKEWFKDYLNALIEKNVSFIIHLYRSYEKYLNDYPILLNISKEGEIYNAEGLLVACNKLFIDINIIDVNSSYIKANIMLTFVDGVAKMGKKYNPIPEIDSKWTDKGEFYVSVFNLLRMAHTIFINRFTNEVFTENGNAVGEWVFWLNENDLKKDYTMVLYSLDDTLGVERPYNATFNGMAQVIFLNMSTTAPDKYVVNNFYLAPEDQIYNDRGFIPPKIIVANVSKDEAENIIKMIKNTTKMIQEKGHVLMWGIKPVPKRILKYVNGKLIVWDDVFKLVNLDRKPWDLIFFPKWRYDSSKTIYKEWGVKYRGKYYLSKGIFMKSISYSRGGTLLYINTKVIASRLFYGDMPSSITIPFCITAHSMSLGDEIIIKLVNYG